MNIYINIIEILIKKEIHVEPSKKKRTTIKPNQASLSSLL